MDKALQGQYTERALCVFVCSFVLIYQIVIVILEDFSGIKILE